MKSATFSKYILCILISFFFFLPLRAEAQLPSPYRIGGTVTVNNVQLTQATGTGYTFKVTRRNGPDYDPGAVDNDGLSNVDWYLIDIPMYDATGQPYGAKTGDLATIHVLKYGVELMVISPPNGELIIGTSNYPTQIDLTVADRPMSVPVAAGWGSIIIIMVMFCSLTVYMKKREKLFRSE